MSDAELGICLGVLYLAISVGYGFYLVRVLRDGGIELDEKTFVGLCYAAIGWPIVIPVLLWKWRKLW